MKLQLGDQFEITLTEEPCSPKIVTGSVVWSSGGNWQAVVKHSMITYQKRESTRKLIEKVDGIRLRTIGSMV